MDIISTLINSQLFTQIINYNEILFFYINKGMENSFLNFIMPILTDFGSLLAWCLLCGLLYIFGGEKAKKVAFLGLIALFLSNVAVYLLKPLIAEPRPFLVLSNVHQLIPETEIYSFPSGHTASSFAAVTVIGSKYNFIVKNKKYRLIYPLLAFAALIGFSRVYIGVHYPLDIVFGALIGILCGLVVLNLEKNIFTSKISNMIGLNKLMNLKTAELIKNLVKKSKST
ncbi:MAG TPA: phosphatase PAP2 family protein [Methanobacterium sp.]|nr:phosphatase PAP2 family protein [Methanobacterium sp.]